jgi:hypothetical protein
MEIACISRNSPSAQTQELTQTVLVVMEQSACAATVDTFGARPPTFLSTHHNVKISTNIQELDDFLQHKGNNSRFRKAGNVPYRTGD